jgi:hypothetical protein
MSIIGESFEGYVKSQINTRQILHGKKSRSNSDLNLLSNQNAWVKLASSVQIVSAPNKEALQAKFPDEKITETQYQAYTKNYGDDKLKAIGLTNTSKFMGTELAKKSVLFNTISAIDKETITNPDGTIKQKGSYRQRSGVLNRKAEVWDDEFSYGLGGTSFGIVPPPGIISAKVNCKNRGSIREATVEIKAQNKFQFELIELLYLRLGYSMMLEWGWDKYQSSDPTKSKTPQQVENTIIDNQWFKWKGKSFNSVLPAIEKYRELYEGNYDGFLGKVVNFDWTFNQDGSYDITLKLITVGDVIESLTVNLPQNIVSIGELKKQISDKYAVTAAQLKDSAIVTSATTSMLAYQLFLDVATKPNKFNGSYTTEAREAFTFNGEVIFPAQPAQVIHSNYFGLYSLIDEDNNVHGSVRKQIKEAEFQKEKFNYFLTFGELMNHIHAKCIPSVNGDKMLSVDTSDNSLCSVFPYQVSMDPKVCLIKPAFEPGLTYMTRDEYRNPGKKTTAIKGYLEWMKRMKEFAVFEEGGAIYGRTMNIYLNYDFVASTLKETSKNGEIKLFNFLKKLCDGVNAAIGGINKLEPILRDDNVITIIDQNPLLGIETSKEYSEFFDKTPAQLELFGYNPSGSVQTSNFVRDFKFNTTIGPNIASMISIGATAEGTSTKNYDGTAFSAWNRGLQDRFQISYNDPPPPEVPKPESLPECHPMTGDQLIKAYNHFLNSEIDTRNWIGWKRSSAGKTYSQYGLKAKGKRDITDCPITNDWWENRTWPEYVQICRNYIRENNIKDISQKEFAGQYINWCIQAFGGKSNSVKMNEFAYYYLLNPDFTAQGKQLFKSYVKILSNKIYEMTGNPSNTTGFIPVGLDIKTDGLSGIKIYNGINVRQEFLPPAYPNSLNFVISKVDHDISENDWTTNLKTISTANTKKTNYGAITQFKDLAAQVADEITEFEIYKGQEPKVTLTSGFDVINKRSRSGLIYYPEVTNKKQIVIHHTAGRQDAKGDIAGWRKKNFPIATHYIIERGGHAEHVFSDKFWSNHIGMHHGSNVRRNKESLSIELTSMGWLTKKDNGTYQGYVGKAKTPSEWGGVSETYMVDSNGNIVRNPNGYKGKKYFQSYSATQLTKMAGIIDNWSKTFGITISNQNFGDVFPDQTRGVPSQAAVKGTPGIYTHNSYRGDKIDVMPQKELLEIIFKGKKSISSITTV